METCETHKREERRVGGRRKYRRKMKRGAAVGRAFIKGNFIGASSRRGVNHTRWDSISVIDFISIRSISLTFFHTFLFFYCGMN